MVCIALHHTGIASLKLSSQWPEISDGEPEDEDAMSTTHFRARSPEASSTEDVEELPPSINEEAEKDSSLLVNPYSNKVQVSLDELLLPGLALHTIPYLVPEEKQRFREAS